MYADAILPPHVLPSARRLSLVPRSVRPVQFWDDSTGNPIHTCQENPSYCPDAKTLADMKTMSIWAEGVEGDVNLQVSAIAGYECTH